MNKRGWNFFFAIFFLAGFSARAGGPFMVDDNGTGEPAKWAYDSARKKHLIRWKADKGPLNNRINNPQAVDQWVKPLFDKWKNATLPVRGFDNPQVTVALDFVYDGTTDVDITRDTVGQFIGPDINNNAMPTVIIFDHDGSIIQDYFGDTSCGPAMNCIAGFATPITDSSTKKIVRGFIVLNGRLLDGVNNADNKEMDAAQFKGVILHEMGHLLNLDHSQVNVDMSESCKSFNCPEGTAITTMYPASISRDQFLFHTDDVVSLSWLYPADVFKNNFCTIVGEVQDREGRGMQGVNVIAKGANNAVVDARSWVSGSLYPAGTENGTYILAGLTPGEDYQVLYEELLHKYDGGGGYQPLVADSPVNLGSDLILALGGGEKVKCDQAGETLLMPTIQLTPGATANLAEVSGAEVEEVKKKKGWFCQLDPQSLDHSNSAGFGALLIFLLLFRAFHCYKPR